MAAVRYRWMFRTAAVVYLLFGAAAVWRYGLTGYNPTYRIEGIGCGLASTVVGTFLFRRTKFAIVLSAISAAALALIAVMAVPALHGPPILAFAAIALVGGSYAVLAARALIDESRKS
jgi:peptidoglycan/LPS O-acetylase OafA/YrhL